MIQAEIQINERAGYPYTDDRVLRRSAELVPGDLCLLGFRSLSVPFFKERGEFLIPRWLQHRSGLVGIRRGTRRWCRQCFD